MGEEEGSVSSWRLVVTIDIVCQSHSGEGSEHHHQIPADMLRTES